VSDGGEGAAREGLLAERRDVLDRLARLRADHAGIVAASEGSNADDEHDPEGATIAFERQQVDALVRQAERRLAEVDAAMARAADVSYGTCERCGRPIPPERLAVRPSARTCVPCASPSR
jgi:RNA polymerase-binding transcription factor DksA